LGDQQGVVSLTESSGPDQEYDPGHHEDEHRISEYIEGVLKRVMVVVLLGCVGLTAGVACGTLFSGNGIKASMPSIVQPAKGSCHNDWRLNSPWDVAPNTGVHHTYVNAHGVGGCVVLLPLIIRDSAPSGQLPIGGYVLFGLVGGLSAALGFLVPPRRA
jgi:hypothetical protein